MTKYMVTVVVGVFIGAFTLELLGRKSPGLLAKLRVRARGAADDFRRSFTEGYDSVVGPPVRSRRASSVTATAWEPSSRPPA